MTTATAPAPALRVPDARPAADAPAPVASGAGWLGLGAVVVKSAQTAGLLVCAAVLAPEDLGAISVVAGLLNVIVVVADLGTATALVPLRGDAERAARTALTLALGTSVLLLAGLWAVAPWLSGELRMGAEGVGMLRGVGLCVPFVAASGVSAELLRRRLAFRRRVVPDMVANVTGAGVVVVGLVGGLGPYAFVLGLLAQSVLLLGLFWAARGPVVPGWSLADARDLLSLGRAFVGSGLLTVLLLNVDYVLVAHHLGAHDLGIYSMSFRLAYMPYLLIAMVVGGAAFAHLSRRERTAAAGTVVDAAVLTQVLVVPCYVGLLVLAPGLTLLGDQWAAGVTALRWLAGYGLVLSALEIASVVFKALGRTTHVVALAGTHLVLLVAFLAVSVDDGIAAVATAQVAAGLITLVAAGIALARVLPELAWRELVRRLAPVLAGAAALSATAVLLVAVLPWSPFSALGLAVVAPASGLAYLAAVALVDRDDEVGLRALARRRRAEGDAARRPAAPRRGVPAPARRPALVTAAGGLLAVSVVAGTLVVRDPATVLLGLTAAALVTAAVLRLDWAAIALVVTEPFGDLLRDVHPSAVKAVGLLVFASWALLRLTGARGSLQRHAVGAALVGLMGALLASSAASGAGLDVGRDHALTYLAYILLVVVLVDVLRTDHVPDRALVRRLMSAYYFSCTVAGAVATTGFLRHGGRAGGPLADPNDMAFFLVSALPFGLVAGDGRSRRGRWLVLACAVVLVLATLATFSRGALLALGAMALVALATGALRVATAAALVATAVVGLGLAVLTHGEVVDRSLAEKEHIAAANVDSRYTTWTMAAEMIADSPLVGQGPGGFEARAASYVPADVGAVPQTVVHDMYLEVATELGLPGLAAFACVLGLAIRGAVRARSVVERRAAANAVLIAFSGTLVAALFLSEQFYLPVWLLAALGLAIDPGAAVRARRTGA
ncbi:MAG TPA: O-antigen ligase family protein [Nocardioides sp.]|nr:O-antigen ligase family protein [Nocardioides sp.]